MGSKPASWSSSQRLRSAQVQDGSLHKGRWQIGGVETAVRRLASFGYDPISVAGECLLSSESGGIARDGTTQNTRAVLSESGTNRSDDLRQSFASRALAFG